MVTVDGVVALSSAKDIISTSVGELSELAHKITITDGTTASQLKGALVISEGASVEIVTSNEDSTAVGGDTVLSATNIIVVTAQDESTQTYAIEIGA